MKAKVKYPKLKSKNDKKKTETVKVNIVSPPEESCIKTEVKAKNDEKPKADRPGTSLSDTKESSTKIISMSVESPVIIRKETVTLSHPTSPDSIRDYKSPERSPSSYSSSNRSSIAEEPVDHSPDEAMDEESPLKKIKPKSSLTRGPGTFRKRSTFV